jgi:outer membrane protein assembly factor BamC
MEEKYILDGGGDPERTVWNPRPTDHGLEAEMLRRIMNYMGVADQQSRSSLARTGAVQARSRLVRNSSEVLLLMDEELNRAWRLTGVALDRVGFAVEDRDITKRVYYVRYNDPLKETEEPGLLSKLAFWRDNDQNIDKESQYQVGLEADGRGTRVEVRNKEGVQENSETALRILTLLHEQLQ